jgi:hypothetical protein
MLEGEGELLEHEMPPRVGPELAALRDDFRRAIRENEPEDFANVLRQAWHLLSNSESDGHDTVQPLFESAKTVIPLFKLLASAVFELERWALRGVGGLTSGGNMILHGVKGVGKTTLMRGFSRVLEALSKSLVLVFVDYQISAFERPLELLRKTVTAEGIPEAGGAESMEALLRLVTHTRKAVVFFADEVQQLYEAGAERDAPTCLAVADLLAVGKTENCLGILAGSTSQLRALVFRRHADRAVDPYRYYPDLNNTVYPTHTVAPLRTQEEMKGVLRQRAQRGGMDDATINSVLSEKYINAVFSATGGVGRLLPLRAGVVPTKHNVDEFLARFAAKPAFRKVMSRLFYNNGGLKQTDYPQWTPRGLAVTEVQTELVGLADLAKVWNWLNTWTDDALAFFDGASIQFFSACHFEALREFLFTPNDPAPLLRLSLEGTLGGWGEGAGSPGERIEQYLQERYALSIEVRLEQRKLTFAACAKEGERVFRLRVPDVAAEGDAGGGADAADRGADDNDMLSFAELRNVLFNVTADCGLDAFIVKRVDVDAHTVYLEALQIKTGRKGKQITPGGRANDRRPDDKTMRGIVVKAARGAKAFRDSVNEVYKAARKTAPTLEFELFTFITNKTLNEDATATYVDEPFVCDFGLGVKVPVDILAGDNCYDLMDDAVRCVVDPL